MSQQVGAVPVNAWSPRDRGATLLPAVIAGATVMDTPKLADARIQFERRCIEVAADLGLSRQALLKTIARVGILKTR